MKLRKVKDLRKPGNKTPKTEKQLQASKLSGLRVMTLQNPVKNPESRKKMIATKKRKYGNKIPGLNPYNGKSSGFKNKKHSEMNKAIHSMRMKGRPASINTIIAAKKNFLLNNPMKNPAVAKKNHEHPNVKAASSFTARTVLSAYANKPQVILPHIKEKIINEYVQGKSMTQLEKETHIWRRNIRKLLIAAGIAIRADYTYLKTTKRRNA